TPKVRENESRLLADHMVMQRHNMDARLSQSLQHGLHFLGGHDEIAIHRSQLVAPRESRPGGESRGAADLYVVHASFAADHAIGLAGPLRVRASPSPAFLGPAASLSWLSLSWRCGGRLHTASWRASPSAGRTTL